MFRHPNVTSARQSVEIDTGGRWETFLEITVTVPVRDQNAIARVMQSAVDWAATENVYWDKLRIIEAD